jgi:hypothetical protein
MTDTEQALAEWEEAVTFAHAGQALKTPVLVAAKLILAGDRLARLLKESDSSDNRS